MTVNRPITIVVPVYGDWPSLNDCIESLKANLNPKLHKVLLVNDCGPDADSIESNVKKVIDKFDNFEYHRNKKNLGFIGTCNRAVFKLDKTDNDILLLNSDTIVTSGFIEEMSGVLYESSKNGAVSPRSNNATLATIPLSAAAQKGLDPKESYRIYKKIKSKLPRSTVVPVAHGFCILIKRDLIKKYGLFDEVFGKGYGEEVDFCLRIKNKGYLSLLANWAYVFHLEARSFSIDTKNKYLEKNNKIIWTRYPDYRQLVREYMEKAIVRETAIEKSAWLGAMLVLSAMLKTAVKRNKTVSRIIRKLIKRT